MTLSPLQSRLVASLAATMFLAALYVLLFAPQLALADDSFSPLELSPILDQPLGESDDFSSSYSPSFDLFDRGIVGRQQEDITTLTNNVVTASNLDAGAVRCYVFRAGGPRSGASEDSESTTGEGGAEATTTTSDSPESQRVRRQNRDTRTVFITASTCQQPHQTDPDEDEQRPPQLTLLASVSGDDDGCPRSTRNLPESHWIEFEDGLATLPVDSADDIYISVMAQNVSSSFTGVYNFDLAASTDEYYHKYSAGALGSPDLLWMDSDSSAALLATRALTEEQSETKKYMEAGPPFMLYVENDKWRVFDGLRRSVCAMSKVALIEANRDNVGRQNQLVRTTLTARGLEGLPRQQFYFEGLNATSTYNAILVKPMNTSSNLTTRQEGAPDEGIPGGGGIVYKGVNFTTLRGTTCKVVTDLEFCDEVQYAVPGSDSFSNGTELARVYDRYARDIYSNFEKVMMQIPCEAEPSSQYSLISTCQDCKDAYKRWLCSVAVPRCEDYTSDTKSAFIRNVGQPFPNGTMLPADEIERLSSKVYHNASRNRFIDEEIAPGPYKEILPCEEICYDVVQRCPAAIGFQCPRPKHIGFNATYGRRGLDDTVLWCNYPGEPRTKVGAATSLLPARWLLSGALLALGVLLR